MTEQSWMRQMNGEIILKLIVSVTSGEHFADLRENLYGSHTISDCVFNIICFYSFYGSTLILPSVNGMQSDQSRHIS